MLKRGAFKDAVLKRSRAISAPKCKENSCTSALSAARCLLFADTSPLFVANSRCPRVSDPWTTRTHWPSYVPTPPCCGYLAASASVAETLPGRARLEDTWPFAPHPRSTLGERHSPLGSCAQHHPARGWHSVPKGARGSPRRRIRRTRRTTGIRKHGVPLRLASLDVQSCLPSGFGVENQGGGATPLGSCAQHHPARGWHSVPRGPEAPRRRRRTKKNQGNHQMRGAPSGLHLWTSKVADHRDSTQTFCGI